MTPSRIPPPSPDDIPRPVASPDAPPAVEIELDGVPYDDEVETVEEEEFRSEKTALTRRCIGCAGEFLEHDDDVQPPATYDEAWGRYGGKCRGTRDPNRWAWCRGPIGEGRLVMPSQGIEVRFTDPRKGEQP
jgi:hypothetical protein